MAIESNYVFTGGRKEEFAPNINLAYNPATGANLRFQDMALTPFPDWGVVRAEIMTKRSNYSRVGEHLHQAVREPVAGERDLYAGVVPGRGAESVHGRAATRTRPIPTVLSPLGFPVAEDIGGLYGLAATEQRHRATFNGIWEHGRGLPAERPVLLRLG